ncbi:sensor histidine kinase [Streptomyces albus]|uniref:sensor histidine kinase n=1 Tax=Streptomyces albus TaxID=1888 RepID=UPI0006E360F1|nr:HAMP domain-containing sensor histidine kinase [Streptomyces albus]
MGRLRTLLHWRSLHWKIASLVAVACTAVALTVGLLVHRSTLERSLNDGAAKAKADLAVTIERYERDGREPDGVVRNATELPDELLRRLRDRPARAAETPVTWYDSDPYDPCMWAARYHRGRPFAECIDMTSDLLTRQALDRHMWKYSLVVLAIVVPVSALAAELPHRRLRAVARTARRISDGDLSARTAVKGTGDEISVISATVNAMADSLHGRLRAEQRFTADVAHELRTPLMGLVTASELLPPSEATDLVRDRVAVLRNLVEDLLEISRLDAGAETPDTRPVPLADVVRDCLARTGLDSSFTADAGPLVDTDPRRLDRIVTNLVVNAHRHGRAPVEVTVAGPTVTVRDHGSGFPARLLAEGPRRFATGASERGHGHGLGLTIALAQAEVIGARLEFANAPDGGAVAVLSLRERQPADTQPMGT